jgi:pSer/pThr/pTyr-binding forkhead associated (FHA) protein
VAGAHAIFSSSDGKHQFPLLSDRAAIGRFDPVTGMRPEVDLSALDINRSVSRHHARLVHEGEGYALTEEVGALNGTYVSGKRLTTGKPARLHHGDEVSFGMVKLMFQVLGSS